MIKKLFVIILLLLFFSINLHAQTGKFITPYDFIIWDLIDDFNFDKVNNWTLTEKTSLETASAPSVGKVFFKKVSPGVSFRQLKGERFLLPKYDNNPSCLGFKVFFPEFIKENVYLTPKEGYKLEGNTDVVSFWLLGRGKNIDFDIVLKDYLGRLYYIPVTKLDFLGWKYFEVNIPKSIAQNYNLYPQKEIVEIAGFTVANHPTAYSDEIYGPIYIYIDQLEFYSNQYRDIYPGIEISDTW